MKRVKIMLMTIVLLGAIGGTLAFNAKFDRRICTAQVREDGSCPLTCRNITTGFPYPTSGPIYCYKVVENATNCINALCETTPTTIILEEQ